MDELEKYLLEQAKIEVDYTRSWPNKLLAFYVAINFGLAGSLLTLATRDHPLHAPLWVSILLTTVVVALCVWTSTLLIRNHHSYLRHRNIQVKFQIDHSEEIRKRGYVLPDNWFKPNEVNIFVRLLGWSFYFFNMLIVTALTIAGIWVAQCV